MQNPTLSKLAQLQAMKMWPALCGSWSGGRMRKNIADDLLWLVAVLAAVALVAIIYPR